MFSQSEINNYTLDLKSSHLTEDKYTGWTDQICGILKITLLNNQMTCRKCKDSFGIVRNRATKYALG